MELSLLVKQILDDSDVPDLEEEINQLVYDLYKLTSTEIIVNFEINDTHFL